jgi:subtilase family serine protease
MRDLVRAASPANKKVALASPLMCALLAGLSISSQAGAGTLASIQDMGAVRTAAPMQAVVWLKGRGEAAFDRTVADLYDDTSPSYHRWLSSDELANYAPAADEIAAARASLEGQGLHVDQVLEGGTMLKVSGTAGKLQAAFGTTIHQWKSSTKSFLKTSVAPHYQGANAQLIGGLSSVGGVAAHPFALQQVDVATGHVMPGIAPQAGTDPLAAFTSECFGPDFTAKMSGRTNSTDQPGLVVSSYTGPTYLDPTTTTRKSCGYTAKQLVQHYGLDAVHALGWTGKGETIVIVDAYGSPTLGADVETFSQVMGLPDMKGNKLQVVYPDGLPNGTDGDWAVETTLDVEYAHAFAPDAKIVVVVAPSQDNAELAYAVDYAAQHGLGNVISNSWGVAESEADADTAELFNHVFKRAAARGVSVNVATGDSGDNGVGTPVGAATIPADSPYATGIGGTSIGVPSDDGPVETAWGTTLGQFGETIMPTPSPLVGFLFGSGGGESAFLAKPGYQRHLPGKGRQLPDISALGDPQTGAIVMISDTVTGTPRWKVIGGTSLATPMFAAVWTLANQAAHESLGQAAPALAKMPDWAIRDVVPIRANRHNTRGQISVAGAAAVSYTPAQLLGLDQTQPSGFVGTLIYAGMKPFAGWNDVGFGADSSLQATRGWDNATGYGVPNGVLFITAAALFARDHH